MDSCVGSEAVLVVLWTLHLQCSPSFSLLERQNQMYNSRCSLFTCFKFRGLNPKEYRKIASSMSLVGDFLSHLLDHLVVYLRSVELNPCHLKCLWKWLCVCFWYMWVCSWEGKCLMSVSSVLNVFIFLIINCWAVLLSVE